MAAPRRTAAQHLDAFRRILLSLDRDARQTLTTFWGDVRSSLNSQDDTIKNLQQQVAQAPPAAPIAPPPRPDTSNSVDVVRQTVMTALQNEALYVQEASNTIEEIYNLDPAWTYGWLRGQRNVFISNGLELGCWVSGNAAAHANGYSKVNMRGTQVPGSNPRRNFTCNPFSHQVGIVAAGHGDKLLLASGGGDYEVCIGFYEDIK